MTRPVIGVVLDHEPNPNMDTTVSGVFSRRPFYALRTHYFEALWQAGALPVALPYEHEAIPHFLTLCQGIVTPGGRYPFPDSWYGKGAKADVPDPRFGFEVALTKACLDQDKPILGICCGMQVMGGIFGAKIHEDVMAATGTTIDHLNEKPAEEDAHAISIIEGSKLHQITGVTEMMVNTAHREALYDIPETVAVSATAPDGVVEAIEIPGHRFALGVQWHPEFYGDGTSNPHAKLFDALVSVV